MSIIEEVRAAEQDMKKAQAALRDYAERKSGHDRKVHLRLSDELTAATDRYIQSVLTLNSK
jgi:hypothetical protein